MKRLIILFALCCVSVSAQTASQRVVFTSSNPPTSCVSGKLYTNSTAKKVWLGTSIGACQEVDSGTLGNAIFTTLTSDAADPADAGAIRLGNNQLIEWEKAATGTDWTLGVNASDVLNTNAPFASTVSITTPLLAGGTANGATLTLEGSSGAAPASSYVIINPQTVAGTSPGGVFIGAPASSTLDDGSTSDQLHIQGSDSKNPSLVMDGFVSNPIIMGRTANGTAASKTATSANQTLFHVGGRGYQTATNAYTGSTAAILFKSGEAFTSTNQGSYTQFFTTAIGSTTVTERWRIAPSGDLITGTDNSWDIGASGATRARTGYFGTSLVSPLFQSDTAKVLLKGTGSGATQIASSQTTVPTCTTNCGSPGNVCVGSDSDMICTMGTTPASGFVIAFNGTWAAAPSCHVQMYLAGMVVGKMALTAATTTGQITIVTNGTAPVAGDRYAIQCRGVQ